MGQRSRSQGKKERSYHKEYSCEISKRSKVISKVKIRKNERQDKNDMPPDLRYRGHRNHTIYLLDMFIYKKKV